MTTPGNVVYFGFTNNVESDKKKIYDMLHPGDMVLVNVKHPEVYMNSGGVLKVADYSNINDVNFAKWESCTNDPVEELVNMDMYGFFVKANDLFYTNSNLLQDKVTTLGSNVFLRCENDWYHIDFGRRFPFILVDDITVGLYNVLKHNVVVPNLLDDGAGVCPGGWGTKTGWSPDQVSDYAWEVVDDNRCSQTPWNVWGQNNTQSIAQEEPQTPPNPVRNLLNEFDQATKDTTGDNVVNYESDSSDIELTSGSESDAETDVEECAQDPNDVEYSDSEYSPSESGSSDSSCSSELSEMDDDFWDEKREDVDGEWYTRRQFYDYYGSDEAWDNLDPNVYHQYRYDDQYGTWATKEEFYQHYGSYRVWKRMHPMKIMRRKALWDTYCWSMYLPKHLRTKFIRDMLETYE
jgi:hypothetical protein